jgi:hypothetical protein
MRKIFYFVIISIILTTGLIGSASNNNYYHYLKQDNQSIDIMYSLLKMGADTKSLQKNQVENVVEIKNNEVLFLKKLTEFGVNHNSKAVREEIAKLSN